MSQSEDSSLAATCLLRCGWLHETSTTGSPYWSSALLAHKLSLSRRCIHRSSVLWGHRLNRLNHWCWRSLSKLCLIACVRTSSGKMSQLSTSETCSSHQMTRSLMKSATSGTSTSPRTCATLGLPLLLPLLRGGSEGTSPWKECSPSSTDSAVGMFWP